MGQASSRGTGTADSRPRSRLRPASWAPTLDPPPQQHPHPPRLLDDSLSAGTATPAGMPELQASPSSRTPSQRFAALNRLPRLPGRSDAGSSEAGRPANLARRPSRLSRYRDSLTSIPSVFTRRNQSRSRESSLPFASTSTFPSPPRASHRHSSSATFNPTSYLPRMEMPDLGLDFDDHVHGIDESDRPPSVIPRLLPLRSHRRSSSLLPSLRSDRGLRSMANPLHRRRAAPPGADDQAVMLSRLLSYAAATTAASLMGEEQRATSETAWTDGEDGTFASFLQALQNGNIVSDLQGSDNDGEDGSGSPPQPLNFFRMFRFGSSSNGSRTDGSSRAGATAGSNESSGSTTEEGDGRMVPIIIVGIRSITPGSGPGQDDNIPPFLDALSSFPTPIGSSSDDNLLPRPPNTTRFSHRRRASMGGLNNMPQPYDSTRSYRTSDRPRPWSTLTDSPSGPMPPPSTPASSGLSAVSSGTTTPTFSTSPPSPTVQSSAPSRRGSFIRRATGTNLEPTVEEPHAPQRTPRQRRLSESDFTRYGSGASRRNGVVEPDHNPGEGSRSWIIYVLGGNYPENHPILTTPSLFTDSPTYEDMLLLSSLLGPAKPPVASEEDVASAPGLLRISTAPHGMMVAETQDGSGDIINLAADARCLVCLCDYQVGETARKLIRCGHMFHQECIDQWLTTGRNSCPLCRGQGVDEKTPDSSKPAGAEGVDAFDT